MDADSRSSILMVSMEPPASLEEEFNDWYDTEHFPQRLALPGFASASRWVCLNGWPRWMALYDLASAAALQTDAYRAVSGQNSTPWSRRLLPRTVGRTRVVATALDPSQVRLQHEKNATCRLLAMSMPVPSAAPEVHTVVDAIRAKLPSSVGVQQLRWFQEENGTLWMLAAFDAPVSAEGLVQTIGRPGGTGIATFNLYAPYQRSGY